MSFPNPADPTDQQVDDAYTLIDADLPTAIDEMIRLAETKMPDAIARKNTARGLNMWIPVKFDWAPVDLTNDDIHSVLFEVVSAVETAMSNGRKRTDAEIHAHFIGPRLGANARVQMANAWRIAASYKAIMFHAQSGKTNPGGLVAWGNMLAENTIYLPLKWRDYSGATVPFRAIIWPGSNGWT